MKSILRFLLYDNPSRHTFTQLGSDRIAAALPQFGYGLTYRIEDDDTNYSQAPVYVVANITRVIQIPEPDDPTQKALLFQVFLARLEEWGNFQEAEEVHQMREVRKKIAC